MTKRDVTLVGQHIHEGKPYVKGDTVSMEGDDADWYAKSILQGRRAVQDNPHVRAIAQSSMAGDITARTDVETTVPSDERPTTSVSENTTVTAEILPAGVIVTPSDEQKEATRKNNRDPDGATARASRATGTDTARATAHDAAANRG